MRIDWPLFAVALLLLWIPRSWMRRGARLWSVRSRRNRGDAWMDQPQDGSTLAFRREFRKPRNYFDLFRAGTGALAVVGGLGLTAAVAASETLADPKLVLAIRIGVPALGVLIQTVRYERGRVSLTAAPFYLAGVLVAFCTPWGAVCGFVFAWALSPVVPHAQGFLTLQAIASVAFGILFRGIDVLVLVGGALCFTPVLLSLLARRRLVVFSRRGPITARIVAE